MEVSKVNHTCSMVELGDVSPQDLKYLTKFSLKSMILVKAAYIEVEAKTVMYNCTMNFWNRLTLFLKFGFRCGYSYMGNHGKRVYVLFLKLK